MWTRTIFLLHLILQTQSVERTGELVGEFGGRVNSVCIAGEVAIVCTEREGLWRVGIKKKQSEFLVDLDKFEPVSLSVAKKRGIAAVGGNGLILYSLKEARSLYSEVLANDRYYWGVAFSPDEHLLAVGGDSKDLLLYSVGGHITKRAASGHRKNVTSVCFSPSGELLASSDSGGDVRIWDVATLRQISLLKYPDEVAESKVVSSMAFSADGKTLASGDWGGYVCIWDVQKAVLRKRLETRHESGITKLVYVDDASTICTSASDGTICLIDTQTFDQDIVIGGLGINTMSFAIIDDRTLLVGDVSGDRAFLRIRPYRKGSLK